MTIDAIHSENHSIGAYIINLDRSKERYQTMHEPVQALGYPLERISAVDGKSIPQDQLDAMVDFKHFQLMFKNPPKIGTIGCSLSHFKTWETFLKSPYEYALIFEDDVTFESSRLKTVIEDVIRYKAWDICSLDIKHRGLPLSVANLPMGHKLAVYLVEVTHTGCYIINRKAAQILLKKAFPIQLPIDHYFTRIWESGLTFVGVENPRLVRQTFGDSEINSSESLSLQNNSLQNNSLQIKLHRGIRRLYGYVMRFVCNLHRFFKFRVIEFES